MTPERFRRVDQLISLALERPANERAEFIREACAGEEDLRIEVEALLAPQDKEDEFLAEAPAKLAAELLAENPSSLASTSVAQPNSVAAWQVVAKLAEGGMAIVYKARDTRLRRHVALKFLRKELATDRQALERFQREARAASALNHPNICTIYELGESEGRPFIAMELVEGQTLRALAARPLPWPKVAELGAQVARVLAAAHAAGIIHRDIKPENLMVRSDGHVKVLDFGLARLVRNLGDSIRGRDKELTTRSGTLVGTVDYMSPEQARGEELSSASDVFSLGVVLYELCTAQHPFCSDSPITTLHAILSQAPLSPSWLNPKVPPQAESLILRMLEKDARLRPSAAAVKLALVAAGGTGLGGAPRPEPKPRRALLVPVAVGLAAALAATLFYFRGRAPPEERVQKTLRLMGRSLSSGWTPLPPGKCASARAAR